MGRSVRCENTVGGRNKTFPKPVTSSSPAWLSKRMVVPISTMRSV